jgi:hypothetical protein
MWGARRRVNNAKKNASKSGGGLSWTSSATPASAPLSSSRIGSPLATWASGTDHAGESLTRQIESDGEVAGFDRRVWDWL